MPVDDTADQHDDLDTDSLFGSPPPSPGRGRSPSPLPLALPSGQDIAQNVGTLALPGSHLCSELPPALPPAPMNARQRPASLNRQRPPDRPSVVAPTLKPRTAHAPRKAKASRRSTVIEPRPTPPIQLPSPDKPLPPNFLRNSDALLGHAGLVAGIRPADLALQRHTRGQTSTNPIVVEEEDEQPLIGRRPLPSRIPSRSSSVPAPSYEEIIQTLVKQKNFVPVLDALLRVVTGSTQVIQTPVPYHVPPLSQFGSSSSTGQTYSYHHYPYAYPYSYYYPLSQPQASTSHYLQASAANSRAPKRRRLSSVPAGAGDWDVPYPFAEGQGPPNYRTNWERERSKQLIEDLIGLVKSAARKAAAKKVVDEAKKEEAQSTMQASQGHAIGSVEYYRDRVLSHYRPQQPSAYQHTPYAQWSQTCHPSTLVNVSSPSSQHRARAATTPIPTSQPPHTSPVDLENVPQQLPDSNSSDSAHFSALEPHASSSFVLSEKESSLEERSQSEPPLPSNTTGLFTRTPDSSVNGVPNDNLTNLDDFLSFINNLPIGDLDALFSADYPNFPAEAVSTCGDSNAPPPPPGPDTSRMSSFGDLDPNSYIDPVLLALSTAGDRSTSTNEPVSDSVLAAGSSRSQEGGFTHASGNASATTTPPIPTPVGSPLSLADLDPPTPQWDFSFPEPEIVRSGGSPEDSSGVNGRSASEIGEGLGVGHATSSGGPWDKRDKGKGRALDIDNDTFVNADDRPQQLWHSEPATVNTSLATSRQSTPGLAAQYATLTTPFPSASQQATSMPSPSPSISIAPFAPWQRSPYAHHYPYSSAAHGTSGSRLSRPPPSSLRSKVVDREDVLTRARAMRAQLVSELQRAKIELWETAMESGCLVALNKEQDRAKGQLTSSASVDVNGTAATA